MMIRMAAKKRRNEYISAVDDIIIILPTVLKF